MAGQEEVYHLVYLVLLFASIDAVDGLCTRGCRPYPTPQKSLEMKCRKKSDRMFYLDVRCSKTVNGDCSGSIECSGLQQEVLRQVAEECYWARRCTIVMNKAFPNILNLYQQCTNVLPDVFESRALCVKNRKLLDFYGVSRTRLKDGVVRISSNFPWDYNTSITIHSISLQARGRKLRVTFLEVDLDSSTDQLVITTSQNETNVLGSHRGQNLDFSGGTVTVEFTVGSSSRRGKGFVFCFSWLGSSRNSEQHACDLVGGVKCLPGKIPKKRKRKNRNRNRNISTPSPTP